MLSLLNFIKNYYRYFIYLFSYLLFICFLNILFNDPELMICVALIIYFLVLISLIRKFIVVYFFFESELIYLLFFIIVGLIIIHANILFKYLNCIFSYDLLIRSIIMHSILSSFIEKFKFIFFYYIFKIINFFNRFSLEFDYDFFFLDYIDYLYMKYINKFIDFSKKNIRYFLAKFTWYFSKMYLLMFTNNNNITNYVS